MGYEQLTPHLLHVSRFCAAPDDNSQTLACIFIYNHEHLYGPPAMRAIHNTSIGPHNRNAHGVVARRGHP